MSGRRSGEPSGCSTGAILASRRSDRSATASADCVAVAFAAIAVALASSDTATMAAAVTAGISHAVPTATIPTAGRCPTTTTAASSATTSAPTAAFGERRPYYQCNDSESEHEHSESRHVACLPWIF